MKKTIVTIIASLALLTSSTCFADKPFVTYNQKKEAKEQQKALREGRIPRASTPCINGKALKDAVEKAEKEHQTKNSKTEAGKTGTANSGKTGTANSK